MGYSTCLGRVTTPHEETRSCDGCDRCPRCQNYTEINMWCWKCCGKLMACPNCARRLATHIVERGAPEGEFRCSEALAGYRAALSLTRPQTPKTPLEVLNRYPILVGHLICASLGYFTPRSACNAVLAYLEGRVNYCEWYSHMARGDDVKQLDVGRDTLDCAFRFRRSHSGMMAEYGQAKALVDHVRQGGEGPTFASWF